MKKSMKKSMEKRTATDPQALVPPFHVHHRKQPPMKAYILDGNQTFCGGLSKHANDDYHGVVLQLKTLLEDGKIGFVSDSKTWLKDYVPHDVD